MNKSSFSFYKHGEIIFKQGDFGDQLFIILKGTVNVIRKYMTDAGYEEERIIGSIYDGQSFGELALLGTSATNSNNPFEGISSIQDIRKKLDEEEIEKKKIEESLKKPTLKVDFNILANRDKLKENVHIRDIGLSVKENPNDSSKAYFERTKRLATIQACEDLDVLSISRENYQAILLKLLQKDLDEKIKILLSTHLFPVILMS